MTYTEKRPIMMKIIYDLCEGGTKIGSVHTAIDRAVALGLSAGDANQVLYRMGQDGDLGEFSTSDSVDLSTAAILEVESWR